MTWNWRVVGKWLLVLPVFCLSSVVAAICLEFSVFVDRPLVAAASGLHVAPPLILALCNRASLFAVILILVLPSALAAGFALCARWSSRWHWGLFGSLVLCVAASALLARPNHKVVTLAVFGCAAVILGLEAWAWIRNLTSRKIAFCAQLAVLLVLLLPNAVSLATERRLPSEARKVWSVVLQSGTWQAMNTGSEFDATRQMVIAGDRIVLVFDAAEIGYQNKEAMSKYRILSLDRNTGSTANQMEFTGRWGAMPHLFATNSRQVVLENGNLQLLDPNLVPAGRSFSLDRGRVLNISPDGSTLAMETLPGTALLDANTFSRIESLSESTPTSISRNAALSNNVSNPRLYPMQILITETKAQGSRTIFHDKCGGRPEFLSTDRILLAGCGSITILDNDGKIVARQPDPENAWSFAGGSQNGTRFALQASDEMGDPSMLIDERFYIYDAATATALATISVTALPERQSWTAFSPDGRYFAVGNPDRLTLYEIP